MRSLNGTAPTGVMSYGLFGSFVPELGFFRRVGRSVAGFDSLSVELEGVPLAVAGAFGSDG